MLNRTYYGNGLMVREIAGGKSVCWVQYSSVSQLHKTGKLSFRDKTRLVARKSKQTITYRLLTKASRRLSSSF